MVWNVLEWYNATIHFYTVHHRTSWVKISLWAWHSIEKCCLHARTFIIWCNHHCSLHFHLSYEKSNSSSRQLLESSNQHLELKRWPVVTICLLVFARKKSHQFLHVSWQISYKVSKYSGKMNLSVTFLAIVSAFVHLFVGLFKIKYKLKNNINVEAKSLFAFTTNMVGTFSLMSVLSLIPMLVNKKEPDELDKYPNYLLLFVLHHYTTEINLIFICVTYFCNSKALRTKFLADFKHFLNLFNSSQTNVYITSK